MRTVTVCATIILILVLSSCGAQKEENRVAYTPAPDSPLTVGPGQGPPVAVDMNGDGLLDIVSPAEQSHTNGAKQLSVFLGDGNGRFTTKRITTNLTDGAMRIAVGDINNDNYPDIAATQHDLYQVSFFLNDGTGNLEAAPQLTTMLFDGATPHTHNVALADINADGNLDVLATLAEDNAVAVLLGEGNGHFQNATGSPFPAGAHPYEGLQTADMNSDGHIDIIAPNMHGSAVTILIGDGQGHFEHATGSPFQTAARPGFAAVGDIDNNNTRDVIVTHTENPRATIILNPGSPDRTTTKTLNLPEPAWNTSVVDIDNDANNDLVLGGVNRRIMILYNKGDGTFTESPDIIESDYPHPGYTITADVNGDDIPDLILGHFESNYVELLLAEP